MISISDSSLVSSTALMLTPHSSGETIKLDALLFILFVADGVGDGVDGDQTSHTLFLHFRAFVFNSGLSGHGVAAMLWDQLSPSAANRFIVEADLASSLSDVMRMVLEVSGTAVTRW
jgi:hypothetical protein